MATFIKANNEIMAEFINYRLTSVQWFVYRKTKKETESKMTKCN